MPNQIIMCALGAVFVAAPFAAGCGAFAGPNARTQPETPGAEDTALLSTIVRAMQAEGWRALRVDPRPLLNDEEIVEASFARVPPAVLKVRQTALRNLGVDLTDATAFGQHTCPGFMLMVPPESLKTRGNPHAGCPQKSFNVVAIGLPRVGTARLPPGTVHALGEGAAVGYWAVRVVMTSLGPAGSHVHGYDYVMKKEGRRWRLIEAVPIYNSE